jgi:2-polyprenyl-3-methyl-5-hydroxy-6-metoxy-1,4-benzoquinol methylase
MNKIYKNKKDFVDNNFNDAKSVLDVGFWGQGLGVDDNNWVHMLLVKKNLDVYGVDLDFDISKLPQDIKKYKKESAEKFSLDNPVDIIFASDLIEHLSNPGLFLDASRRNIVNGGKLIITTPNTFSLFNIIEKFFKAEPTVNKDHTCYFNKKTITQLLQKNQWEVLDIDYIYSLELDYKDC